jgi:hypothetical protein
LSRWPALLQRRAHLRAVGLALLLALPAALACQALHVPLPWMIGPLVVTALAGVSGLPIAGSMTLRNGGLWLIGVALGLYFTPPVVALLGPLAPAMAVGVFWALFQGYAFHRFLRRVNGRDAPTTFFAAAIGGASEMALLAERHQGQVDLVAASHSLRVLMVVVLVPVTYQWLGVHGADVFTPVMVDVQPLGLLELLLVSALGVGLLWWLKAPNPWVLGALLATAVLTASGVTLSALPRQASNVGQLFIGIALGSRFTPGFLHAAPRWLGSVAVVTLGMIAASALFAWGLAQATGLHPATVMLGTSPGGIAEMCITAKVLQLGVPVVTVFHLVRYLAVLTLTAPLYRLEQRRLGLA